MNIHISEMAGENGSANDNSSSFLLDSHTKDSNYYSWCADYPTAPTVWSAIGAVCFRAGLPVSVLAFHESLLRQRQKATIDIFSLSLAVINLIFTAQIPFIVCNFMIWHIEEIQTILIFFYSICVSGRPLFMACTCWDCYVAVVYPIMYKTSKKLFVLKKAITIAIFLFIVMFGSVVCTFTVFITTPFIAIPLILALPVIYFCDISILLALTKTDQTGNNIIHPQKKQALHIVLNTVIMTCVVYLPAAIIFLFGNLMLHREVEHFCCLIPYAFSFSTVGCVIMPAVYMASVDKLDTFKNCWKK